MKESDSVEPQFYVRNMIVDHQNAVDNAVDDAHPFYHDRSLFDSLIYKVHLNTRTVLLKVELHLILKMLLMNLIALCN
jgi:hypothetical protein